MITRSIQFGTFFQRVDAFFILIWVLTFFSYLSVIFAFTLKITNKNLKTQSSNIPAFLIGLGVFIVTLIPQNIAQIRFAENVIYQIYLFNYCIWNEFCHLTFGIFEEK